MSVKFLDSESPEAILDEVMRMKPQGFICAYCVDGHVTVAGQWKDGRLKALGMLLEAQDAILRSA
jgi:hypothetical protein